MREPSKSGASSHLLTVMGRILTREGRVKTLNVIVESGVVRIIGDQGQRSQISLMSLN